MSDRYIDPNSGAAPQPGGYAHSPVEEAPASKAENVTLPEDARTLDPQEQEPGGDGGTPHVEELTDEQIRSQSYDTELQNQAAPLGSQPGAEREDEVGAVGTALPDPSDGAAAEEINSEDSEETSEEEEPAGNASLEEWQR